MPTLRPGETFDTLALPSPAAALAAYAAALPLGRLGSEAVALDEAAGRVLSADIAADAPYPGDPRSTMDGYAVRSHDGAQARRLDGDVHMGRAPGAALAAGTARRVPTGGVLPDGADAVVPIEAADAGRAEMTPHAAPLAGAYVTPRGSDMHAGALVLAAGRRIGAAELGVLATLGRATVDVVRLPRLAVISTGDELVDHTERPGRGQIRDSNRWTVGAVFAAAGFAVAHLPPAPDDLATLRGRLAEALLGADAVVLTGGSSVGARDLTPEAIEALGGRIAVHGIRVKPGKPTVLAQVDGTPVIGLPGNPASAMTIALAIGVPALRALTGEDPVPPPATVRARAAAAITGRAGWTWYVPATLRRSGDGWEAGPLAVHSAHVSLLARADGYVVVGPDAGVIAAGADVEVVPLPRNIPPPHAVVRP